MYNTWCFSITSQLNSAPYEVEKNADISQIKFFTQVSNLIIKKNSYSYYMNFKLKTIRHITRIFMFKVHIV